MAGKVFWSEIKPQKTKTHCLLSWIVSNNVGLECFPVGFPSTKWLEHILDSSDATKFSLPLLTSVCHHLRLALSFGNLCHFKIWTWDFISSLSGQLLSLLHIPTQHLSFLTISFVSFWVLFSTIILLPFSLSVYKSFTFKLLRKNGVIRKFKVQFATHFCLQYAWNSRIFIKVGT